MSDRSELRPGIFKRWAFTAAFAGVVIVGAGWSTDQGLGAKSTVRGLDPMALFPAGTVLVANIDGGPCTASATDLALSKLWHEAETQEFVQPLMQHLHEAAAGGMHQMTSVLGLTPEELHGFSKAQVMFGVTRLNPPPPGAFLPDCQLMLAANLRGQEGVMRRLLDTVGKMVGGEDSQMSISDCTCGGVAAKRLELPEEMGNAPFTSVTWVLQDTWLVAATDPKQLEAALSRIKSGDVAGSLVSDELFARTAAQVFRPKTMLGFYLQFPPILALVNQMGGTESKAVGDSLKTAGFDAWHALAYGVDLDGVGIRDRFYLDVNPDSPLMRIMAHGADVTGLATQVPASTIAFFGTAVDLAAYYDYVLGLMSVDPGEKRQIDKQLAQMRSELGFDLKSEVLAALGPEFGAFASMPKYGFVPDIGILFKVKDRAKIEGAIKTLLEKAGEAKVRRMELKVNATTTLNYLDISAKATGNNAKFRPTYGFVGDYLLVTAWPQAAKNIVASLGKSKEGLFGNEDFKNLLGHLRKDHPQIGASGLAYLDLKTAVGILADAALPAAQFAPIPPRVPIDVAKLPSTETLTKHLFGIVMAQESTKDGFYADYYSPMGVVTEVIGFGMVAAIGAQKWTQLSSPPPDEGEDTPAPKPAKAKGSKAKHATPESQPKPKDEDEKKDGDKDG